MPPKFKQFQCTGCGEHFPLAELRAHLKVEGSFNPFDPGFYARCPVGKQKEKEKADVPGVEGKGTIKMTQRRQAARDGGVDDGLRLHSDDRYIRIRPPPEAPPKAFADEFPVGCEVRLPDGCTGRVTATARGRIAVTLHDGTKEGHVSSDLTRVRGKIRKWRETGEIKDTLRQGQALNDGDSETCQNAAVRVFPVGREVVLPGGQKGTVTGHARGRVGVKLAGSGEATGALPEDLKPAQGKVRLTLRQQAAKDGCIDDTLRCKKAPPPLPPGKLQRVPLTEENLAAAASAARAEAVAKGEEETPAEKREKEARAESVVRSVSVRRSVDTRLESEQPLPRRGRGVPRGPPSVGVLNAIRDKWLSRADKRQAFWAQQRDAENQRRQEFFANLADQHRAQQEREVRRVDQRRREAAAAAAAQAAAQVDKKYPPPSQPPPPKAEPKKEEPAGVRPRPMTPPARVHHNPVPAVRPQGPPLRQFVPRPLSPAQMSQSLGGFESRFGDAPEPARGPGIRAGQLRQVAALYP